MSNDDGQLDMLALLRDRRSLAERWAEFDAAHPEIYLLLRDKTRELLRATGGRRLGIALPWEAMRWTITIQTGESPKLNNDYKARYARKLMAENADLADVFVTRHAEADDDLKEVA